MIAKSSKLLWKKLEWQLELWNSKLRSFLLGELKWENYLKEGSKEEQTFLQILEDLQEVNPQVVKVLTTNYENIKLYALNLIEMRKKGCTLLEIGEKYKEYEEKYCLPFKRFLQEM
ncbi:MAG: hypothetical protein RMJ97_09015 [Raineya sp.]|nr:hypothetical protein [Raineya sp.]MDW8297010.1 hypothetical protein [Raineya sp.]